MWRGVDSDTLEATTAAARDAFPYLVGPPRRACAVDARVVILEYAPPHRVKATLPWRTREWRVRALDRHEEGCGASITPQLPSRSPHRPPPRPPSRPLPSRTGSVPLQRVNRGASDESCKHVHGTAGREVECSLFERLPLTRPTSCPTRRVPWIYHSTGSHATPPYLVRANAAANPAYRLNYLNDSLADVYVRTRCGDEVHRAYRCIRAPAYRADLLRFCALSSEGGVYLDGDLVLLHPMEEVHSPCASATVGHDFPWGGKPGMQMKIVAGVPHAPLFECMLRGIVDHVRRRVPVTPGSLEFSGPVLLRACYAEHSDDVAVTYLDTRGATWPFSGMRNASTVLAYEVGRWGAPDPSHYSSSTMTRAPYTLECGL